MNRRSFTYLSALLALALPSFAQDYILRNPASLGGGHTLGFGMNSRGDVVGESRTPDNVTHGFLWTRATGSVNLDALAGQPFLPRAINTADTVAGSIFPAGAQHAAVWSAQNGLLDLGTLGGNLSFVTGINDDGSVAGCSTTSTGIQHAFLWQSGVGMADLDGNNSRESCAFAINGKGEILGQVDSGEGTFIWSQQTGLQFIGLIDPHPFAFNDSDAITGYYQGPNGLDAFYWTISGGLVDLGLGFGESINNHGQVLGDAEFDPPFLWTQASGRQRVPQLGHSSWSSVAINDAGQILVRAKQKTVLLTPAVHVSLGSSSNPSKAGQSVTFTATASSVQGAPPDGEFIVFKVDSKILAKAPLSSGNASVTTSALKTGNHNVTAQYVGDVNYFASKSRALVQVVSQ